MIGHTIIGRNIIALRQLKPTQMTVGMLQVKHKRKGIRKFAKQPAELVEFILEHPIRVVRGPVGKVYVIDHHHLALALIKEQYATAPMQVEEDFSACDTREFWKKMRESGFIYPYDAKGKHKSVADIPKTLFGLKDDPYRSLAGFVRLEGGFSKVETPFAEFLWAHYFREHVPEKLVAKRFPKALKQAMALAKHSEAQHLPGYIS